MTLVVWQPSKTIVRRRTQLNILLSDGQVIIKVLWWECRMDTGHSWTQKTPAQEKEMATHSSILAWKNPWTEEPGRLKSMGLHDWACVHKGEGRWVGSNKPVELKKKNKKHQLRVEPPRGLQAQIKVRIQHALFTTVKRKKKNCHKRTNTRWLYSNKVPRGVKFTKTKDSEVPVRGGREGGRVGC